MTLNEKIAVYRQKLAQLSPESPMHTNYSMMISELERELAPAIRIHQDPNDQLCESCQ